MITLPLFNRIKSELAYRQFQAKARAEIAAARGKHARVNPAREKQTATLHAALAGRKA